MSRLFDALQNAKHGVTEKFEARQDSPNVVLHAAQVTSTTGNSGNRYTALLKKLKSLDAGNSGRLLAIMGPHGGEGTSTIVKELADFVAQQTDERMLVLDCQPEGRPAVAQTDRLSIHESLDALLSAVTSTSSGARQTGSYTRAMLPDGTAIRDQPWNRDELGEFFESLRSTFGWVILDCPPVLQAHNANSLARLADASILVVESERSEVSNVIEASDRLSLVDANVLGVVLNKHSNYVPSVLHRILRKFGIT